MAEETTEIPSQNTRTDRRRELSIQRSAQKKRRAAYALIGVFLLIIVGIVIAVYVREFILPPRELVVKVDNVEYTRGDMVKLLRVRQRGAEFLGETFNAGTDVFQALQLIVENEIIAQTAPGLGITVTEEEVDLQIERIIAPTAFETGGKSEEQIDREFRERYGSYLNTIQLSREEHRLLIRKTILRQKVRQFVGESVPTVAEQVHVYRLVVDPNDEIDILNIKYKDAAGVTEDPLVFQDAFFSITREFSRDDPETVRRGGNLGWIPRGVMQDYDDIIFHLKPGELSDPVTDVDVPRRLFMFMVSETADAREVSPFNLNTLKNGALQDWINDQRGDHEVYAVFNSDIYNWIIKELGVSSTITPTPQADPLQNLLRGGGL